MISHLDKSLQQYCVVNSGFEMNGKAYYIKPVIFLARYHKNISFICYLIINRHLRSLKLSPFYNRELISELKTKHA